MISKNRLYTRREPSRDAKLFIIYCEGKKREPQYFKYFKEISSRINFEIIEATQTGNNSPTGLYKQARNDLIPNDSQNLKYEIIDDDEIWFVIDTDTWGSKISELKDSCIKHNNWFVAQSNPCFEVWLYYHKKNNKPNNFELLTSKDWKKVVDEIFPGGFDSRKHPIFIKNAITNSKNNFNNEEDELSKASTEVFKLAERFFPFVKNIIFENLDN